MIFRMMCTDKTLLNGPGYLTAGETYRVGRSSSCSFVVNDLSVSRCHAEVTVNELVVLVKDLGSRNGTYVDGMRVEEATVHPGQSLRFGNAQFQLIGQYSPTSSHQDSEISTHIVNIPPPLPSTAMASISKAQKRVLDLLLDGLSEKEVASRLVLSQHTVHGHIKKIYQKLNVNSRPGLLALFVAESKKAGKGEK